MIIKATMGLQVSLDLMLNSCFVSQENQAFYQTSPAPLFHLPHQEQERAYTKIQGPRFQRNYIIARYRKSDLHGTSFQLSPKINRMLITRLVFTCSKVINAFKR